MSDHVTISMLTYARADSRKRARPGRTVAALYIVGHPLFFHLGTYLTWALGWIALGRPPVPMVDNPQSLGVQLVGSVTIAWLALWPLCAFFSFLLLVMVFDRSRDIARLAAFMGGSYLIAVALISWDPAGIICWFFD